MKPREKKWPQESELAYSHLKLCLKYHLYERRDGGNINQLITEEDTIIVDPKDINEQLARTIEEIQMDDKWEYLQEKSFPILPVLLRANETFTRRAIIQKSNNIGQHHRQYI